jgi:hypothetical protein
MSLAESLVRLNECRTPSFKPASLSFDALTYCDVVSVTESLVESLVRGWVAIVGF